MNATLFAMGILVLIMGIPLLLYSPQIIHSFYHHTGLDGISIYQDKTALSETTASSQLFGLGLVVSGVVFIPLSRHYYP